MMAASPIDSAAFIVPSLTRVHSQSYPLETRVHFNRALRTAVYSSSGMETVSVKDPDSQLALSSSLRSTLAYGASFSRESQG